MSIDRESERDINQILSNVRRQSDTGQTRHSPASHYQASHPQASHSQAGFSQTSHSHPEDAWSSLEPMERTSQASSSELSEPSGWFFDTEGMVCEEQGGGGGAQGFTGPPPPGFPNQHTTPPNYREDTDGIISQAQPLLPMGGVSGEATPTSCQTGSVGGMGELDRKLRDELLEAQTQNKKYKKMLVSGYNRHPDFRGEMLDVRVS